MFGLAKLLYSLLLLTNAIAVLSEDRFLYRMGWISGNETDGVKYRLINLILAIRTLLRVPLVVVNVVVIMYELVLG